MPVSLSMVRPDELMTYKIKETIAINFLPACLPDINMQYVARRRTSCLTKTLPFLGLLHSVLLKPDGIDIDEASCVTD